MDYVGHTILATDLCVSENGNEMLRRTHKIDISRGRVRSNDTLSLLSNGVTERPSRRLHDCTIRKANLQITSQNNDTL